ncbi:MAG: hypothetical protein GIKADHBN_00815 [Phycisphaerales bacterium]|nr:hypothetical protein [Phycisphaerales bacterium]MCK6476930.1 hypothetical protein [Phycisphaerales bacterium]
MTTADQIHCDRCRAPMERGFILDRQQGLGSGFQAMWCPGVPDRSNWHAGTKASQAATGISIVTYRCPSCGLLESYAPAPPTPPITR